MGGLIMKKFLTFNKARIVTPLLLFGIMLFMASCSSSATQEKHIEAISTVLKHQLNGPDLEVIEWEDPAKIESYYEKLYKSYFTEEMYTSFISTYAFHYHLTAYNGGYEMKVDHIEVDSSETTEGTYDFKATLLTEKEGSEQQTAEVSGRVTFNSDDKITSIRYLDESGL